MNVREIFKRQRQKAMGNDAGTVADRGPECSESPSGRAGRVISATSATSATCSSLRVAKPVEHMVEKNGGKEVAEVAEVASRPAIQPVVPQGMLCPPAQPAPSGPRPPAPTMLPMPRACPLPSEPPIINLQETFLP